MSDETNIKGTFECPICGHDKPHGHDETEQIRWHEQHRTAFETIVYKKIRHPNGMTCIGNIQIHAGHRLAYEGHRARGEREWAQLTVAGGYVIPWMQTLWEMYQSTILSAELSSRPAADESAKPVEICRHCDMPTDAPGFCGCNGAQYEREQRGAPVASKEAVTLSEAAQDVLAERQRQVSDEGFDANHDDRYVGHELAQAAASFALRGAGNMTPALLAWPALWDRHWIEQKLSKDRRSDFVKAGALILAEIERIDRAAQRDASKAEGQSS